MKKHQIALTLIGPLAVLLPGCASKFDSFQPKSLPHGESKTYTIKQSGATVSTDVKGLAKHYIFLYDKGVSGGLTDKAGKMELLQTGLNLSDHYADIWLKALVAEDTNSRYYNNTANTVLGVATAVLGITDASSKSISLVGAGAVGLNNQWKNFESAYLYSEAIEKVVVSLRDGRKALRKEIEDSLSDTTTTAEVVNLINSYHNTASREYLKEFIAKSAELAKFSTKSTTEASANAEFSRLSTQLYGVIYPGSSSKLPIEKVAMLIVADEEPTAAGTQHPIRDKLQSTDSALLSAFGTAKTGADGRLLLSTLNSLRNLEPVAAAIKQLKDAAAPGANQDQKITSAISEISTPASSRGNASPQLFVVPRD